MKTLGNTLRRLILIKLSFPFLTPHRRCFAFQGHLHCITDAQTAEPGACPTGFPQSSVFTSGKFSYQYCQKKDFHCRWESRSVERRMRTLGERGRTGWTTTPPWQEWPPTALTKVPPAALGCAGPPSTKREGHRPGWLGTRSSLPAGKHRALREPGRARAELCCLRVGDAV